MVLDAHLVGVVHVRAVLAVPDARAPDQRPKVKWESAIYNPAAVVPWVPASVGTAVDVSNLPPQLQVALTDFPIFDHALHHLSTD